MDATRPLSFKGYRFPLDVIKQAVWLYFRFTIKVKSFWLWRAVDDEGEVLDVLVEYSMLG